MVELFGGGGAQLLATVCQHPAGTPPDPKRPTLEQRGINQQTFLQQNTKHNDGSTVLSWTFRHHTYIKHPVDQPSPESPTL